MNEPTQNETEPSAPPLGDWLWMVRGLLISAMFVTAYLALIGLGRVGRAPGCGPGSGCEQVLSSPWAWWLGVPVALLGLGLYAAFFLSTFLLKPDDTEKARRALNAISLCSFAVLGAAVWFVGVQAVGIGAFCAYCCVAHGLASLAAVLFLSKANGVGVRLSVRLNLAGGMGTAIGVMALIAGVQVFVPHKPPAPKVVELSGGGLQLNTDRLPLLGPADAQHQIDCLFDYTCHHCRQQHGIILETIDGFDGKLACWMVPMPLDTSCNGVIERTEPQHVGACEYAKICLAVHQVAPAKYEAFDRWLFKNPKKQKTLDAVRQYAAGLVGTGFLEKALTSAAVRDQLQENISTYETISKIAGSRMMPQTIISDHVVIGPSQSVAEFEALVREHLNLNEPKPVVKPVPGPEVALDQVVESPDGLIRAKGEEVPFTGHVISRFPDGSLQFKRPVVDGLKHGLAVRWHANGRKAEELPWKKGMRNGLARAWSGTGEKLGEKMFRPKPRERESFEQRLAEAGRVYRKRKKLDETVWKEEAQAQVYEETFVALWDALRAAEDKWKPFEEFVLESIALVKKGKTSEHDWSIRATHYVGGGMKLDLAGWREWLRALRARGIEVVETEWHQEEFDSKDGAPRSVFRFVVHATGPGLMRYIVRGRLGVAWTDRKDARGHFQAGHVEVTEAVVLTRLGKAPFRELARLSPGEGEPKGYPGPEGSAPMSMPLLVYDLDRDGRSEIVLAGANLVYWNQGKGKFKKGTLCKHYRARLQAAVLADFDNDGIADLLGMPEESPPVLYRGGAGGRFEQPPERIEVGLLHASTCVTAGDIDGDGDLDAWLTQNKPAYVGGQMPTPYYDANDGYPSYLIKNDGKGKFTDATKEAGLAGKQWRRTYSSSLVDLDADGDLDLVVVNDFAGLDIHLNDGTGRFTDVTGQLGDDRFGFGMSHALADFNGDGRLDLYMVGMDSTTARRLDRMKLGRAEFPGHQEARMRMAYGNRLFLGGEDFLKQAPYSDLLARTGWAWGCTALDFDNDGDRDLYITNGFISGDSCKDHCTTFWTKDIYTGTSKENPALDGFFKLTFLRLKNISWNGFEHNVLLMNEPGESFLNVAFLMNAAQEFDARAMVSDDVDGDGRVDLVMIEKVFERGRDKADHLRVLLNAWERPGHWIGVRLHEHGRGFSPVGARITVLAGGRRQMLPVVTGDSHLSQHANQKHFGLGAVDRVDANEVRWPNGAVSRLENPAVDRYHEVKPE